MALETKYETQLDETVESVSTQVTQAQDSQGDEAPIEVRKQGSWLKTFS